MLQSTRFTLRILRILSFIAGVTLTAAAYAQSTIAQHIGDPAYFLPGGIPDYWAQLDSSTPAVGIAVANIANGPDDQPSSTWAQTIQNAHNAGVKVLGYVDTGYFGTTGNTTRLGASDIASWRSQIESDVNAWYALYGANGLDGIFFDEGQNACGTGSGDNSYAALYQAVSDYVKQNHPGAVTAINPGIAVPQCFQNTADILMTFEGTELCYLNDPSCPSGQAYQSLSWNPVDPTKIWHLIYGTAESDVPMIVSDSKQRNAGTVYITSSSGVNPYNNLPTGTYWTTEQNDMPGSADSTAPTAPRTLDTVCVAYITATLNWEISSDPDGAVVGYDVYENGKKLTSVPQTSGPMDQVSVDGLQPNTAYSFYVVARDQAGNVSPASNTMTFRTQPVDVAPPTAPGNVVSSSVGYADTGLSWTASNGDASINAYYVFQNGIQILTLPASVTATTIGGLNPGSTYSFTVEAQDNEGNVSAAGTAASVTTLTLPAGQAIANPGGAYTTSTITYQADYLLPFSYRRVFIDSDDNASTGYRTSSTPAVGADYYIENGSLYKYTGTGGTNWGWQLVKYVKPKIDGYTQSWVINVSDLGSPMATQNVVYQGDGYAPYTWSTVIPLSKH